MCIAVVQFYVHTQLYAHAHSTHHTHHTHHTYHTHTHDIHTHHTHHTAHITHITHITYITHTHIKTHMNLVLGRLYSVYSVQMVSHLLLLHQHHILYIRHTSYIIHATSCIIHHTSYIIHHTSYIIHHTSYMLLLICLYLQMQIQMRLFVSHHSSHSPLLLRCSLRV